MGSKQFVASAPAKVNLHLGVGEARADGYHDLVSVFQAVDIRDIVRLTVLEGDDVAEGSIVTSLTTHWGLRGTPPENLDTPRNLAWRAVDAVVDAYRDTYPDALLPPVRLEVEKNIFVAGGMAGGSADAAAALVAANAYLAWATGKGLDAQRLAELGAALGADVPFALMGGTALGTGRGDKLVEMLVRGQYWWVFLNTGATINTGEAFARLDDIRHNDASQVPHLDTTAVAQALAAGDSLALGANLHNDLEAAAVAMRPELSGVLKLGGAHGVRAIVSGSGPTVAVLCRELNDVDVVQDEIGLELPAATQIIAAHGPVPGARLESTTGDSGGFVHG